MVYTLLHDVATTFRYTAAASLSMALRSVVSGSLLEGWLRSDASATLPVRHAAAAAAAAAATTL